MCVSWLSCMPVCLPAYLSVCGWIKEYSVFPYCWLPLLLLLWPSIVSCSETDRKEVLSSSLYTSPTLPSSMRPSIPRPSACLPPRPELHRGCLCFAFFSVSNVLSLSSKYSQQRVILQYNVGGGVWVIGCANTHTHTLPLFTAFHCPGPCHSQSTRHWPWGRWM